MEFLTNSLNEIVSKLSADQKEEIDVIESIVNTNEENKENTKEKVFRFIEKRKPENCINFIFGCIKHVTEIRPKERESLLFLLTSIFDNFHFKLKISESYYNLRNMLEVKNIIPSNKYTGKHIFDFSEEGTVGRAIFEDNFELLQQLLTIHPEEGKEVIFDINDFSSINDHFKKYASN